MQTIQVTALLVLGIVCVAVPWQGVESYQCFENPPNSTETRKDCEFCVGLKLPSEMHMTAEEHFLCGEVSNANLGELIDDVLKVLHTQNPAMDEIYNKLRPLANRGCELICRGEPKCEVETMMAALKCCKGDMCTGNAPTVGSP